MKRVVTFMVLGVFAIALSVSLLRVREPNEEAKEYLLNRGVEETGAVNLVTAIYLAYRAYDTLGETIVLIGSVTGVLVLVVKKA